VSKKTNAGWGYLSGLPRSKDAFDSVPIYNILTKLYNLGIRGRTLIFVTNLYLTTKAHATHLGYHSSDFPIHCGVPQDCPLSPILFNFFINYILQEGDPYGIDCCHGLKCCGSLFADDIVLLARKSGCLGSKEWNVFWDSKVCYPCRETLVIHHPP